MCPWSIEGKGKPGLHQPCQQVEGVDASSLLSPGEVHVEFCVQFWAPQYTRNHWRESGKRWQRGLTVGEPPCEERLRELGLEPGEERALGGSPACRNLEGGCKDRARLFSVAPRARTRGSGHQLRHRRFCMNIRKGFSLGRMTELGHRLPREVESPSLEILKRNLDMILIMWEALLEKENCKGQLSFQPQSFEYTW